MPVMFKSILKIIFVYIYIYIQNSHPSSRQRLLHVAQSDTRICLTLKHLYAVKTLANLDVFKMESMYISYLYRS